MAAPANDNFSNALLISGESGTITGTNAEATNEAYDGDRKPVWYKWVAPFTGKISFDTLSSGAIDSHIIVYRDAYGSIVMAENDDYSSTNYRSYVKLNVILGATYYIGVGSYRGAATNFTLKWQIPPAPAAGQPVNDSYIDPLILPGTSGMVSSTTHGNVDDETLDEGAVWFLYTPAANGTVTFTLSATNGGSFWTVDAWKGESYKSAYWQPANSYNDTGSQVVVTYPAQVALPIHIGVVMSDDAQGDFTIAWEFNLPEPDADSGLTYSTVVSDYDLMYRAIYNEAANEIWVEQERYPQIIARFNESSGELLGYITYSETPSDPIYYDSFSQKVWVPLSGGRIFSIGAVAPFVKSDPVNIPLQYGAAFSPIDGSLWTTFRSSSSGNVQKWNPVTGALLATYPRNGAFDIQFAKDGRAFLKVGLSSPYTDTVYTLDTATGAMAPLGVDNDIARFAIADDRNSLFAIRYVGGPSASTSSLLTEYSLDDGAEIASYPIPYYDQWSFYYYFIYDRFHRRIWINDVNDGDLGSYDAATGEELSTTRLATSGSLTASPSGLWAMGNNSVQRAAVPSPVVEGIINDRDVWLQTFAERFERPTIQPGTLANVTQAGGTGIVIAASKRLDLSATSQTFLVRNGQSEPVYITLTPTLRNLAGVPTYTVISGSATLTLAGNRAQIKYADMASSVVTVRATLVDGGVTYQDQITLAKIVNGGTDITALLSNEMHAVMADSFGNVLNYMGASGDFRLWEGAFEITADCDFTVVSNTSDLLAGISNLGRYTVYGMPQEVDTAELVLRATYNSTNYDRTFYISKIKAPVGSPGDPSQQDGPGGSRLPVNLRIPVSTTTWDSQIATNATAQYGGNVLNDTVTQYNNVANWQETRFWTLTEWVTLDAKIDGNLLVTGSIGVDKLSANAVTAITGSFDELLTQRLQASEAQIDILIAESIQASEAQIDALIAESIQASRAEIDTLVAQEIDAVTANIDTLTVGTLRLEDGSVITSKIGANAVTVPAFLTGDAGGTTINAGGSLSVGSATVNYPDAAEVAIVCNWTSGNSGGATNSGIRVKIDGATVGSTSNTQQAGSTQSHSAVFKATVAAGSHNISVELTNDWSSGSIQARAWSVLAQASMR